MEWGFRFFMIVYYIIGIGHASISLYLFSQKVKAKKAQDKKEVEAIEEVKTTYFVLQNIFRGLLASMILIFGCIHYRGASWNAILFHVADMGLGALRFGWGIFAAFKVTHAIWFLSILHGILVIAAAAGGVVCVLRCVSCVTAGVAMLIQRDLQE